MSLQNLLQFCALNSEEYGLQTRPVKQAGKLLNHNSAVHRRTVLKFHTLVHYWSEEPAS